MSDDTTNVAPEIWELWNSIHGPHAWEGNPRVAAITFTTHHKNVDALLAKRNTL